MIHVVENSFVIKFIRAFINLNIFIRKFCLSRNDNFNANKPSIILFLSVISWLKNSVWSIRYSIKPCSKTPLLFPLRPSLQFPQQISLSNWVSISRQKTEEGELSKVSFLVLRFRDDCTSSQVLRLLLS